MLSPCTSLDCQHNNAAGTQLPCSLAISLLSYIDESLSFSFPAFLAFSLFLFSVYVTKRLDEKIPMAVHVQEHDIVREGVDQRQRGPQPCRTAKRALGGLGAKGSEHP
jgi:hypothetical protein